MRNVKIGIGTLWCLLGLVSCSSGSDNPSQPAAPRASAVDANGFCTNEAIEEINVLVQRAQGMQTQASQAPTAGASPEAARQQLASTVRELRVKLEQFKSKYGDFSCKALAQDTRQINTIHSRTLYANLDQLKAIEQQLVMDQNHECPHELKQQWTQLAADVAAPTTQLRRLIGRMREQKRRGEEVDVQTQLLVRQSIQDGLRVLAEFRSRVSDFNCFMTDGAGNRERITSESVEGKMTKLQRLLNGALDQEI